MTEHVREVSELMPAPRVVFFGQETDIIAQFEQTLE